MKGVEGVAMVKGVEGDGSVLAVQATDSDGGWRSWRLSVLAVYIETVL